jgi:hypothetical protein
MGYHYLWCHGPEEQAERPPGDRDMTGLPKAFATGRRIGAGAALAAFLAVSPAALPEAGAEAAANPPPVAADGSDGYASQAPVKKWAEAIAARNAKVKTLVASYEYQWQPRKAPKPLIEMGVVKFRFAPEPNRPPLERWEGKGEQGKVVRVVRDGKVYVKINDKVKQHAVRDPERVTPSMLRYPLLPEACAARFRVWYDPEFEPGMSGPVAGRNFPTALAFEPRPGMDVSPRLKRFYLALDVETAVAYKIRWHEMNGVHGVVELFDLKPNAQVDDADFAAPAGATKKEKE